MSRSPFLDARDRLDRLTEAFQGLAEAIDPSMDLEATGRQTLTRHGGGHAPRHPEAL